MHQQNNGNFLRIIVFEKKKVFLLLMEISVCVANLN